MMASSLRSALLSPKFLSPLSPSGKNVLLLPKSDRKVHVQTFERPNAVKKLNFAEIKQGSTRFFPKFLKRDVPRIKVEHAPLISNQQQHYEDILNINTPNKQYLTQYGPGNVKHCIKVLGKGAFGTVFKGMVRGEKVAVKVVPNDNFTREANGLNLVHKNIVKTLEIIQNPQHLNYCLILMEYIPKCQNLQDIIDNFDSRAAVPGTIKKFCLDITRGLHYLHHNKGLLHLDLKPKNILVDEDSVCKICDFGNSIGAEENMQDGFKHNGTAVYTAPEILLGQLPTTKSDVYSLGLIFWQLQHRKVPFSEFENAESIIYNVGKHNVRPKCNNIDSFGKIYTGCWDRDPLKRPDTKELLNSLEKVEREMCHC